jgi:hypothetical protein
MPLGDVSYVDAALDAVVASWPSTGATYNLYASDPQGVDDPTTVELDAVGGYAPVAFAPSDFSSASAGVKVRSSALDFGTTTAAYSDIAKFWAVVDSAGLIVYSDALDEQIEVDEAGDPASFTPTLTFETT